MERATRQDKPVIVAGRGSGGLAALGLARKGLSATVLERAPALGEIGAGIQPGPNALHAFDALGLGNAARAMAAHLDRLRPMDAAMAEDMPAST